MSHCSYIHDITSKALGFSGLLSFVSHLKIGVFSALGVLLLPFVSAIAMAQSSTEGAADAKTQEIAISELVRILDTETEIATKSRLNVDFVPGMVTVLQGDDLAARGMRTVWEALSLVPGFQRTMESTGLKELNVRSLEKTFVSGTVKYLVNGIAVNSTFSANASRVLEIPITQIERIEVIRGPGAAIHGEFAYSAVVDIITKKHQTELVGAVEKYDTYRLGGMYAWSDPSKDMYSSINVSAMDSDGADVSSGLDKLYRSDINQGSISNAPGPANEDLKTRFMFFNLGYKDFSVIAQYLNRGLGDHFGANNVLPFPEDRIVNKHENVAVELRQAFTLTSQLDGQVSLGWLDYEFRGDGILINPPGYQAGPYTYTDGMIANIRYEESRFNFDVGITWIGLEKHKFYAELGAAYTEMGDVWQETNYVPSTGAPLSSTQRFQGSENYLEEGQSRTLKSLVLQDEYDFNQDITFTFGLRFDHYDDVGESTTPRLAGVWRVDRNHIIKAQYSSAFRPPDFLEMYTKNNIVLNGNPDIEALTSDNYELGYIYRSNQQVYRVTLFSSHLKDVIILEEGTYKNSGGARLKGVELETEQEFFTGLKLNASVSFTDAKDSNTGEDIPNVSDWLMNIGLIYEPIKDIALSMQYQCVCDYSRAPTDPREDLEGHQTWDISINSFNTRYKGLTLRAGVKNLFDDTIKYPAPPGTYPGDYPRPGRSWWAELSKDF
jgi:iron complex outermembrane receptor protein